MGVPGSKHRWGEGLPPCPRNPQSWNPTLEKKTRKDGAPGSPEVAAETAADVAAEVGTLPAAEVGTLTRNGGRLRMWPRLTEVTRPDAAFPYNKKHCAQIFNRSPAP